MATWNDLSQFTYGELSLFTWDQLNRLTPDELIAIAESKIEIVSKNSPELSKTLRSILAVISVNIVSNIIYDATQKVDWPTALKQFVLFLQSLCN